MSSHSWLILALFVFVCFGAAGLGSIWTASSVNTWYRTLRKPAFTPPNWIFAPVWSALYLMMAVSGWLVWRNAGWGGAKLPFFMFFVQLALNVAWSGLFFGLRRPSVALVDVAFLLAAIIVTAISFLPFSTAAFCLLIPYAAWVSFATFLNFKIWTLNLSRD